MKRLFLLTAFLFLGIVGAANATLIGDQITLAHHFPAIGSDYADFPHVSTISVEEGSGDRTRVTSGYYVDVEADSVLIDFDWYWLTFTDPSWGGAHWTEGSIGGQTITLIEPKLCSFFQFNFFQ